MKKFLILIATVVLFASCDRYNYKSVYAVKDENGNVMFADTLYSTGNKYSYLRLWVDGENYYTLHFNGGFQSDLLIQTKQKVDIISFEKLNKVD